MDDWSQYFAMGGYARFVWPAFGITAVVMVGLLIQSLRRLRLNRAILESLRAAETDDETAP